MPPEATVASLALKLKWISQQFVRDLPTLTAAEKRERQAEITRVEEALSKAEADAASE
ncbi:MAG: hypothetical protein V4505_23265 [Pseudomonadota bacterium]